jgi:hypothetical protein
MMGCKIILIQNRNDCDYKFIQNICFFRELKPFPRENTLFPREGALFPSELGPFFKENSLFTRDVFFTKELFLFHGNLLGTSIYSFILGKLLPKSN